MPEPRRPVPRHPVPRCPVCGRPAAPRVKGERTAFPFCSERCRQVDLGRWFTGAYAVPTSETEPGDDDGTASGQG